MKFAEHRNWSMSRSSRKPRVAVDQTTLLGGLTLALFVYIICHFVYPLMAKGLFW